MTIEVDLREIKALLSELNRKLDVLIEEKENVAIMTLAEKSLKDFLENEPDIYTVKDVKSKGQMQLKGKIVLVPFPFTDLTATKLVNL